MDEYSIREAEKTDVVGLFDLIKKYAEYEHTELKINAQDLLQDGFGVTRHCHLYVVQHLGTCGNTSLVGFTIFTFAYSTFEGRFIHLHSMYVEPEHRQKGLTKAMFQKLCQTAVEVDCKRIQFHWTDAANSSASMIDRPHDIINLTTSEKWHIYSMTSEDLERFVSRNTNKVNTLDKYTIRKAEKRDCEGIYKLIQGLAKYENMSDQVKISPSVLERDGFEEPTFYTCFVVYFNKVCVGYALYFFCYSTYTGKIMYFEDIYIEPEHRKKGLGKYLWRKVGQIALDNNCSHMTWTVLGWNKQAIDFYNSMGGVDETINNSLNLYRMTRPSIDAFLKI